MAHSETMVDVAGQAVVLTYSSVADEYEAIGRRAVVVNQSHRGRMRFTGAKVADVLTGLVTNDVGALSVGQGQYATALTPKGKVVADMRILRFEDSYLTETSPRSREGWFGIVRKYVNPRLAKYTDETATLAAVGVYGSQARQVMEEITGIGHSALGLLGPYAHVKADRDPLTMHVVRVPDLVVDGFEILVPSEQLPLLWDAAIAARATPAGLATWEVARVEAGRPEWGVDMDDNTLVQEANLDELGAVSYTKGCYTGQEVVARVHFRGHVNRTLRGLKAEGAEPPRTRATLFDAEGKSVGDVRSSAVSPKLGGIALGLVRREVENGAQLVARWSADPAGDEPAGEVPVQVVALPFSA
jgi:folate-binding protein YgfZ